MTKNFKKCFGGCPTGKHEFWVAKVLCESRTNWRAWWAGLTNGFPNTLRQ